MSELPAEKLLTEIAHFEALANPARVRILMESSHPITVADLINNIRKDDNRPTPATTPYAFTYALAPTGSTDR